MGTRIGQITFGGLSSGLPTDEIISQLLELGRRPIQVLEDRRTQFSDRLSIFQDLNTKTLSLRDVLRNLDNMANVIRQADDDPLPAAFEEFRRFAATSSDKNVATATVDQAAAASGNLVFEVNALATQNRHLSTTGFSATSDVVTASGGTITLTQGGTPTDVTIAANATVSDVVDAINAAGSGVSAFAVDDGESGGSSVRIALVSDSTGADQSFTAVPTFALAFEETQAAADAQITLDPAAAGATFGGGHKITSATNTFSNVIQGVTLDVLSQTGTGETVTVSIDTSVEDVVDSISQLVSAFNAISAVIDEQNTIDPTTNRGGPLLGDSTLVRLGQRLTGAIAQSYGTGTIQTLGQLGIELDRDGNLSLDEQQLTAALEANFEDAATFFAGTGSFSDSLREIADSFVDPVNGALLTRINGTNDSIADLDESISDAQERLDTLEENLVRQFVALERTISQFRNQGDFLNSFLLAQQPR